MKRFWFGSLLALLLAVAPGCGPDAPRDNPLDPLSDAFDDEGAVSGVVRDRAARPVAGVRVRMSVPGSDAARTAATGADGRFVFTAVPSGAYRVEIESDAYAATPDTVAVRPGATAAVDFVADGLPRFQTVAVRSVHVSRWWPQEDLYGLEVSATVSDPDGTADIDSVWLSVGEAAYEQPLQERGEPGQYEGSIGQDSLPSASLHALLGRSLYLRARDLAGREVVSEALFLARVIDDTPVTTSPQGLALVDTAAPQLVWEAAHPPFAFTYRVDIVRADTEVHTLVQSWADIGANATSLQVAPPLPTGTYFWTVWVVDAFGNRSRSREAGFRVP